MGYVTTTEVTDATTGAQTKGLAAGALQTYIDDASAQVDGYCDRTFVAQTNVVEYLESSQPWSVVIGPQGFVTLYPRQGFPITNVDSITYEVKGRELTTSTYTASTTTLNASDYRILKDRYGWGYAVRVYLNFLRYRSYGTLLFTIQHDCGFASNAYPSVLKRGTILWVTGLLKRRGAQSMYNTPDGMVALDEQPSGEITLAMKALQPLKRVI